MEIGLLGPATLLQLIIEVAKVVENRLERPATLPQVIVEFVDIDQVLRDTITIVIAEDMLIEVDTCQNITDTIPLAIRKQELMLKGEADKGLRPATISPITKANVVYFLLFKDILLVVVGELYLVTRPDTIPTKE